MAVKVLKEGVNRSQGANVHAVSGVEDVVIAGMAVYEAEDNSGQIGNYPQLLADTKVTATALVAGIALESNQRFQVNTNNPGAGYGGQSGDYTSYNRGGLVSYMGEGAVLELSDDGRLPYSATPNATPGSSSHPVDTSKTYVKNERLYVDATNGKITNDPALSASACGVVKKVTGSGQQLVLTMEVRF